MDLFFQFAIVLMIGVGCSFFMYWLKQPLILGHLLTGILVGPVVLNIFHAEETFEVFSKLGITALLFIVGLSLSPKVIREVGKTSLILGTGQVFFTSVAGFLLLLALGWPLYSSLFIAIGLTFSSTIIVLKSLQDKRDLNALYGRLATGTMLVQDIAATIILVVLAAIGAESGSQSLSHALLLTIVKALFIGIALLFFSRSILPRLTKTFATSQEFLLLFSVAWGVGIAALFKYLGFSIEVGALVAGVSLATSPYHYEISSKMKILRDFFLVLFFVTLGASLTFSGIETLLFPAVILSFFVLAGNPLILFLLLRVLGYGSKPAFQTGITMAQVSEFSLVVLLLAKSMGYVDDRAVVLLTICAMITIALSSYLLVYDDVIYQWLYKLFTGVTYKAPVTHVSQEHHDAILLGCHRLGEDFLPYLKQYKHYVVVDYDPTAVERLQKSGITTKYGDAEDNEFLEELGIESTKLIVTTIPDIDIIQFVLTKLRKVNKKCIFIAMAHSPEEAKHLYAKGASYVILPHYLGGNYAALLLEKFGLNATKFEKERQKHLHHLTERISRGTYAKRAV